MTESGWYGTLTCLAVSSALPRLVCDFYSSAQNFACGFLQIPPHDGHPCRSANTSYYQACSGLSPPSYCPWRAYKKSTSLCIKSWYLLWRRRRDLSLLSRHSSVRSALRPHCGLIHLLAVQIPPRLLIFFAKTKETLISQSLFLGAEGGI